MIDKIIPNSNFIYFPSCQIDASEIGILYKGINKNDNTSIVVKVVPKSLLASNKQIQGRLKRVEELYNRGTWKHENIVNLYGCFNDQNNSYFVQEYCDDGNLKNYIQTRVNNNQKFEESEALNILKDILLGYTFLKNNGIQAHRCLKPNNIMIKEGKYKINDYDGFKRGVKYGLNDKNIEMLNYQAPEILFDENIDEKADIWSIGIILFEMLFLEKPFEKFITANLDMINEGDEIYEAVSKKINHNENISNEFKSLISQMLIQNPQSRLSFEDIATHYNDLIFSKRVKYDNLQKENLLKSYELGEVIDKEESNKNFMKLNTFHKTFSNVAESVVVFRKINNNELSDQNNKQNMMINPNDLGSKIKFQLTNASKNKFFSPHHFKPTFCKSDSQDIFGDNAQSQMIIDFEEKEIKNKDLLKIRTKIMDYMNDFSMILYKIQQLEMYLTIGHFSELDLLTLYYLLTRIILGKYQAILKLVIEHKYPDFLADNEWLQVLKIEDATSLMPLLESSDIMHKVQSHFYTYFDGLSEKYLSQENEITDDFDKNICELLKADFNQSSSKTTYNCFIEFCRNKQAYLPEQSISKANLIIQEMIDIVDKFKGGFYLQRIYSYKICAGKQDESLNNVQKKEINRY